MGKVPFFGNPDDTHCFQAVIRMLLKYQFSELEYSWSELDRLTGKKEDSGLGLCTRCYSSMTWGLR